MSAAPNAQEALAFDGQPTTPDAGVEAAGATRQRERRPVQPTTCGGCDCAWTGASVAHCSSCHATFASVALFDQHRRETGEHGRCLNPADVRYQRGRRKGESVMFFRDGLWRGPEMTDEQIAKLRGDPR